MKKGGSVVRGEREKGVFGENEDQQRGFFFHKGPDGDDEVGCSVGVHLGGVVECDE